MPGEIAWGNLAEGGGEQDKALTALPLLCSWDYEKLPEYKTGSLDKRVFWDVYRFNNLSFITIP